MFKRLATLLAGLMLAGSAIAQTSPDEIPPCLIYTPQVQDISERDLVIGYDRPLTTGGFYRTTVTLTVEQYLTGKIEGIAKIESNVGVPGQPVISLPQEVPVKGKIKGTKISIKGKKKIAGGADFHSRTISISITGNSLPEEENGLYFDEALNDYLTTVPLMLTFAAKGLGDANKGFTQKVLYGSENYFHYQLADNIFGEKPLPSNARYFDIATPNGYHRVPGYFVENQDGTATLDFKGNKIKATVRFAPFSWSVDNLTWKSGTNSVNIDNPVFTNVGFIVIDQ